MGARLIKAKSELRYADPSSWLLSATTDQLLKSGNANLRDETGIIHVAQTGPKETMAAIAKLTTRHRSSPLKFPAAAPSSAAAVACYVCKLRGPSLTLTMPWQYSTSVIQSLCKYWFDHRLASLIIVSHEGIEQETGEPFCEAHLFKPNGAVQH
jgi:hypothetical protein